MRDLRKNKKLYFPSQWAYSSLTTAVSDPSTERTQVVVMDIQILQFRTALPRVAGKTISSSHAPGYQMCSLNFNGGHADEQNNAHF